MTSSPRFVSGLRELADQYTALIVDLWGVVHDGVRPFPGVVDALRRLRAADRQVCLLSNAPRRVEGVRARLREIGVPDDAYDHLMTSGEATHEALIAPPDAFHAGLGRRCLHIGPRRDDDVHQGTGRIMVGRPEEADFVLCTGIDDSRETVADYEAVLQRCADRGLPMICANPDLVVVVGGARAICAGALAAHYETLGGRVAYHGKPHPPVYERCFALFGGPDRRRVLGVGDALRTDIAGANAAGIDSLLITGGIHAEEFAVPPHDSPDPARIAAAVAETGFRPDAVARAFVW